MNAMHEVVAQRLASALDAYLGTELDVRFASLAEVTVKEHMADSPSLSYVVQFSSGLATVEFGVDLVFPIIELLMGGIGDPANTTRDLSEIEEELMQDVVLVIMRQVESVWSIPDLPMVPGPRLKSSMRFQSLRPTEKLTVLRFEIAFGSAAGSFDMVLSKALLDLLVKKIKAGQPQTKQKIWSFPAPPLRERVLECEMEVVSELAGVKVAVKDLVALQPGSVLKLRAPIQTPGMLTAGGRAMFEANPVRSGSQRAAQLGRRVPSTEWKRR